MVNNKKKSTIEYNNFGMKISECIHCKQCPGRMNRRLTSVIPKGVGNIFSKNLIILSIWNEKDYKQQLDILKNAYFEIYNKELLENCYITWGIKCPDYDYNNNSVYNCFKLLSTEINISNFSKVIVSGYRLFHFYNNSDDSIYIPNIKYIPDINSILYKFAKDITILKVGLKEAKLL